MLGSFPLWERGLKLTVNAAHERTDIVVPLVGTWIEMSSLYSINARVFVVPLVGTWIEIFPSVSDAPRRERRSPCGNVD